MNSGTVFYAKVIKGLEVVTLNNLFDVLSGRFDQGVGFGFLDTEIIDESIQTTLVYELVSHQRLFNPMTDTFSIEQRITYDQVSFRVSPHTGLLLSFSGGARLNKVIYYLSNIFNQSLVFDDLFINIASFLGLVNNHLISYRILGITINNFRPEIGLTGKFTANVSDSSVGQTIIDIYGTDVREIYLEIIGDEIRYWTISATGKIGIKCQDSNLLFADNKLIQHIVLECHNG